MYRYSTVILVLLFVTSTAFAQFERVDAIMLGANEAYPKAAVIDPDGDFAYFGTTNLNFAPARVVKIDLKTFERVNAIVLEEDEQALTSGVIDPDGRFAYFGLSQWPEGKVVKVDLDTMQRVDAISVNDVGLVGTISAAEIDPTGEFAYFGINDATTSGPEWVMKVDLDAFEAVDVLTLGENEIHPRSIVIDPDGAFAYIGACCTERGGGWVVKVALDTFERVDALALEPGEYNLSAAVMDPAGAFAYFGGRTSIVKIDLETFEVVDRFEHQENQGAYLTAVIDPDGAFAYFSRFLEPGRIEKIDLESLDRVDAITLAFGENELKGAVIDPNGTFAYFATYTEPGRVVKVQLRDPSERPENDDISDAIALSEFGIYRGSNENATLEDEEPEVSCAFGDSTTDFSVWWSFTSPVNGEATINLEGSSFDTVLSLHDPGDLSETACNDNAGWDLNNLWSLIENIPLVERQTYLIRIAGYNDRPPELQQGVIQLDIQLESVDTPSLAENGENAKRIMQGLSRPVPSLMSKASTFTVTVERSQNIAIDVFDVMGRRVQTLFNGVLPAGKTQRFVMGASALPAGRYVIRAIGEDFAESQNVTVVH